MKLFNRYNRLNLSATVLIFLLSGIAYYFLLHYVMINQLDENLKIEKEEIEAYAYKYSRLPEIIPVSDQLISFRPAPGNYAMMIFESVKGYDSVEHEPTIFREMNFTFKAGDRWFMATVGKSMEGTENLLKSILLITLLTIVLILSASLIINRLTLKKLWHPFYSSLQLLKDYKVGVNAMFDFPMSKIDEFSFMNEVLQQATSKADSDYQILKEFTENASHEMQTPLAIIRSKLDLLIQDEGLAGKHEGTVQALYEGVQKLSKLNSSLLLLTKIENKQFQQVSEINIKDGIENKIFQFNEIIVNNNLSIVTKLENVYVSMNAELIDILLNNLLSNSLKHNIKNGSIEIVLNKNRQLIVKNSGHAIALDQNKIFQRFYKTNENSSHTGLGLSIIKQICVVSNCIVSYKYDNGSHSFMINW